MKTLLTSTIIAGVLAFSGAAFAPPAAAAPTPAGHCVGVCGCTENVKIRNGAGTIYTPLGTCAGGDLLAITGHDFGDTPPGCSNPWWDHATDRRTGVTGWISECYISEFA